jgi:hypothetical protein
MSELFPDAVRRFVLTSIPSVPHMETLLLLWREQRGAWTADAIAARLFISAAHARSVAEELCNADLLECGGDPVHYRCRNGPASLLALLQAVDAAYTRHLRAVTALIHSNVDRKAARFAQAFLWEKK